MEPRLLGSTRRRRPSSDDARLLSASPRALGPPDLPIRGAFLQSFRPEGRSLRVPSRSLIGERSVPRAGFGNAAADKADVPSNPFSGTPSPLPTRSRRGSEWRGKPARQRPSVWMPRAYASGRLRLRGSRVYLCAHIPMELL
ncbi:hypothetical protein KM043_003845 [Ampulex compressa]|nr:hypothetical protein KM043_003845 [Ampulex compressa]